MKKRKYAFHFVILIFVFFLTGCLQSQEHLIIHKDGSGTFETNLLVPQVTVYFIDTIFGEIMKGMSEAFGGKPDEVPKSIAESMFGDKEEILKKAEKVGLKIKFISFDKKVKDDGLYVNYKFEFDDMNKLIESGLVGTKLEVTKNPQGDLVVSMKGDPEEAKKSETQKQQFKEWQESEEGKKVDQELMKKVLDAMKNFKMEFLITMPGDIKKVSGMFKQKDSRTASVSLSGDIFGDPSIIQKMYTVADEPSMVVSGH